MSSDQEIQARERLTLLWLGAEPAVRAFVGGSVQGFADGEDVVQQVALTVARRFDEYDDARPFVAWALWLAKSGIVDYYRKQGRERLVFLDDLLEQFAEVLVEKQSQISARHAALERCVKKLPEKSRRLLDLRYVDEVPVEEVAAAVGSTAGSVRVMLHRIRNLLADCITSELAREGHAG